MIDIIAIPSRAIPLGRLGENEYRRISFDISEYLEQLSSATFTLLNRRPGDSAAYPVYGACVDGTNLRWLVSNVDVASDGHGQCELVVSEDGVVAKSIIYTTVIQTALDGSGSVPGVWDDWLETFNELKDAAEAAADRAESAVQGLTTIDFTMVDGRLIYTQGGE